MKQPGVNLISLKTRLFFELMYLLLPAKTVKYAGGRRASQNGIEVRRSLLTNNRLIFDKNNEI